VSYLEILESELRKFEIELNSGQVEKLAVYCHELSRWNQKLNLTGLEGKALVRRLVLEPAWVGIQLKPHGVLLDIGSGNGSPAIPLHVVCGFQKCQLIEARTKRAAFLRHVISTLNLLQTVVHRVRFEDLDPDIVYPDWVTLQAVALTTDRMTSIRRIAKATTNVVWVTSATARTELQPSHTLSIPDTDTKVLVFPAAP
jgi:16S rRNA (guanine527-N7)-methyltransferase